MANTFIKISTVTVGVSGATTIDFTSIPQTFTDLKIVLSSRVSTVNVDALSLSINGGATAISNQKYVDGTGSAVRSGTSTPYQALKQPSDYTASVFGNTEFYIPNYSTTNVYKNISSYSVIENAASASYLGFSSSSWSSTSAITSISISIVGGGNFVQYSTATLYGIKSS
jgi:hypothetical protein